MLVFLFSPCWLPVLGAAYVCLYLFAWPPPRNNKQQRPAASAPLILSCLVPFRISIAWIPVSFFFFIPLYFCTSWLSKSLANFAYLCASVFYPPRARAIHSVISESQNSLFSSPITRSCAYLERPPVLLQQGLRRRLVFFPSSIQFSPSRPLTNRLFSTPLQLPFAAADSGQRQGRAPATCRAPAHAAKRLRFFRHHHQATDARHAAASLPSISALPIVSVIALVQLPPQSRRRSACPSCQPPRDLVAADSIPS